MYLLYKIKASRINGFGYIEKSSFFRVTISLKNT